jgi:hypothetical protein
MLWRALKTVFSRIPYLLLATLIAITSVVLTLSWSNRSLLLDFLNNTNVPWQETFRLELDLLFNAHFSQGWFVVATTLLASCLLGIVTSMLLYVWRHTTRYSKRSMLAIGTGSTAAVLGLGCAACGPLLLGSVLSIFGASGILWLLPLHGGELVLIAIALLLYALYSLSRIIVAPAVCIVTATEAG